MLPINVNLPLKAVTDRVQSCRAVKWAIETHGGDLGDQVDTAAVRRPRPTALPSKPVGRPPLRSTRWPIRFGPIQGTRMLSRNLGLLSFSSSNSLSLNPWAVRTSPTCMSQ